MYITSETRYTNRLFLLKWTPQASQIVMNNYQYMLNVLLKIVDKNICTQNENFNIYQ